MQKIRILGIGQGTLIPSYRYRLKETKQAFENINIDLKLFESNINSYPPANKLARVIWLIKVILSRIPILFQQNRYDVIILQREMISTLYSLERFFIKPFILDIDDAIHLHQKFHGINKLAKKANAIIVCNAYLANYYREFNKSVYIIPTPVDINKYKPIITKHKTDNIIIGWIGTSSNFPSLKSIEKELSIFLNQYPHTILKIVSNEDPSFTLIEKDRYIYKKWSDTEDVADIQSFDIGIMPLIDTEHSRGKCAFKMLQYMSCGIPVISTCLPMNKEIIEINNCGFCISKKNEWINYLDKLGKEKTLRITMGKEGRKTVIENFSTKVYAKQYKKIILDIYCKGNN
jgi:glycosyltransferase involved in cell wall biosynthesis